MYFKSKLVKLIKRNDEIGNKEACCMIEQDECLIKKVDSSGDTLLHIAAKALNADVAYYLIECGSEVNAKNKAGKTPIISAIADKKHHLVNNLNLRQTVEILCAANANIQTTDKYNRSAEKIVLGSEIFLEGGVMALMLEIVKQECANDSKQIAEKLHSLGCPLYKAVNLKNAEIVEQMINLERSANSSENINLTALEFAVENMDLETVKVFIKYGADPNDKDFWGRTPLASYNPSLHDGHQEPEIVKIFIDQKVPLTETDNEGKLMMSKLFEMGTREVICMLLESNPNILSSTDRGGMTFFHYLMRNGHAGITDELRGSLFDVNVRCRNGRTPIFSIATSSHIHEEKFMFLIQNGADLNAQDHNQENILFSLISNSDVDEYKVLEIIFKLLPKNLDIQIVNGEGNTVFDIIRRSRKFLLAKPLLAHLALLDVKGAFVSDLIRRQINDHEMFRKYFDSCQRKIEKMNDCITPPNSLTRSMIMFGTRGEILRRYRHSQEIISILEILYFKSLSTHYYCFIFRERCSTLMDYVHLLQNATSTLCELFDWTVDSHHHILCKIGDGLTVADLNVLCEVGNMLKM